MKFNQNIKNFLLLFCLACCWGPSFLFMKIAVEYVPPITTTCIRLLIGFITLLIILKFKKISLPKLTKKWLHLVFCGLFQSAIPFSLFAAGEKYVDSAIAAIITGASPLFTLVIAHFFTNHDKITKTKIVGASIGISGLILLVYPLLFNAKASLLGVIMILIATSCYSISFVYAKKYIHGFNSLAAPTLQLFFGFLFLLPLSLVIDHPLTINNISLAAILSIICLGLFGSSLAFILYYKILAKTNSTYISMVNYMTPIIGTFLGALILNEKLFWNSYLGCAFVLCGVMIANGLIKLHFLKIS